MRCHGSRQDNFHENVNVARLGGGEERHVLSFPSCALRLRDLTIVRVLLCRAVAWRFMWKRNVWRRVWSKLSIKRHFVRKRQRDFLLSVVWPLRMHIKSNYFVCYSTIEVQYSFARAWDIFLVSFSAISCGDPGEPVNGVRVGTTYTYGSIVTFTCQTGYMPSYSTGIVCQPNGQWNQTKPNCTRALSKFMTSSSCNFVHA